MSGLAPSFEGGSTTVGGKDGPYGYVDYVKVDTQVLLAASAASDRSRTGEGGAPGPVELVGAIDQGTSSTRFVLFTRDGDIAAYAQTEHKQYFPSAEGSGSGGGGGGDGNGSHHDGQTSEIRTLGWHEQDPMEIWGSVVLCMRAALDAADAELSRHHRRRKGIVSAPGGPPPFVVRAIGVTNQRETTVAWNARTGVPYYNAIVWDDTRTAGIASHVANGNVDRLRPKTGLPLTSYFAGTKVKWMLDHVNELQTDMMSRPHEVRFGTVDTWIVYQLTGTPPVGGGGSRRLPAGNVGGLHLTDVSNASRWLFLDLEAVRWDQGLVDAVCAPHVVPLSALPEVRSSSEVYATLRAESTGIARLEGVPVAAILGDQQAALFGQVAFEAGEAKNTYGTGMFLMMNTGPTLVPSKHGLLTTIAYKVNGQVAYALEGSVSHSGSTIQWLKGEMKMIDRASDSEALASASNDGLYLVPAFSGLFAPHWRADARGCIVGITAAHGRGHVLRAALEAAAYQARELFDAIYADSRVLLTALKVDGGGTENALLMQFQADMIRAPVVVPVVKETTAMGAAFAAGLAVGVWKDLEELKTLWRADKTYVPQMTEDERQKNWAGWKKAVTKSLGWVENEEDEHFLDAETFSHDDEDDDDNAEEPLPKVPRGKGASAASSSRTSSTLQLLVVGAVGIGAGFLLGRNKR